MTSKEWIEENTSYEVRLEVVKQHLTDSCPPGVTVEKFKLVADIAKRQRQ